MPISDADDIIMCRKISTPYVVNKIEKHFLFLNHPLPATLKPCANHANHAISRGLSVVANLALLKHESVDINGRALSGP